MEIAVGKKIGMTQIEDDEKFVGVSVVEILPLVVTQLKTKESDGYSSIQMGILDDKRKAKLKKPQIGHLKKIKERPYKFKEFLISDEEKDINRYKIGEKIDGSNLGPGDLVTIVGMSYGRGFQGMIKRHHAHRGPKTHGSDHHRAPGSIGMCSFPARVFKGKNLPGRDGAKKATIKNLKVVKTNQNKTIIFLNGSVPGKKDSYIGIKLSQKAKKVEA